jgi:hypothetical protein
MQCPGVIEKAEYRLKSGKCSQMTNGNEEYEGEART